MNSKDGAIIRDMANDFMNTGYVDIGVRAILASESRRSSNDVSYLIRYIRECQKRIVNETKRPLSIREMKENMFKLIGVQPSVNHSYMATLNRADIVAIYNFIIKLPDKYFENREGK